jgi:hypothetical protein
MTRYKELCEEFSKEELRQVAIDRILRELPVNMKQAITEYLAAPTGIAAMPTVVYGCETSYVDLYRPTIDESGPQTRTRGDVDNCLCLDREGMYCFGIGIYDEKLPGSLTTSFSMMHFTFCVEAFDEHYIELRIKNMSGSIQISNANDRASYADAAKLAIERIVDAIKNPTTAYGSRAPFGFTTRQSQ